jgi:uncharacterized protein YkwD
MPLPIATRRALPDASASTIPAFRQRVSTERGTAAENVGFGCDTEDCAIRRWAASGRHRANMLRRDVKSYGIASAVGSNGRRYWVLELGN